MHSLILNEVQTDLNEVQLGSNEVQPSTTKQHQLGKLCIEISLVKESFGRWIILLILNSYATRLSIGGGHGTELCFIKWTSFINTADVINVTVIFKLQFL